ncbi:MAG: hypothetical protein GY940_28960 [bacterium]|nr:hypothetical protein [bacterium]
MTKEDILNFLGKKKHDFKASFYIKEIGIYGSYARGEQKESSDIDIVYILEEKHDFSYFKYLELGEMLSAEFKKKVELVNYKYMNPLIKYKAQKEIIYV